MLVFGCLPTVVLFACLANPAMSEPEDRRIDWNLDPVIHVKLGYGRISANELIYNGSGDDRISHLIWKARVPITTIGARLELDNDWTLSGQAMFSLKGTAEMTDYDWLPRGSSTTPWTHRSRHPDSELEQYADLELAIGRDYDLDDVTQLNLHGGMKYTRNEWHAAGGSYVYSQDAFRDSIGDFTDGQVGVSYKQQRKTVFAGAELTRNLGYWRLSGLFRAGVNLDPRAVDHHRLRDLRLDQKFNASPFLQIGFAAEHQLENGAWLHIGTVYQRFFRERGDMQVSEISTGRHLRTYEILSAQICRWRQLKSACDGNSDAVILANKKGPRVTAALLSFG